MSAAPAGAFRSLRHANFRLWWAGTLVSNTGTWIQRTAQDWLVLTALTHHSASSVGIVMALQFAPQLLLLPWTGSAADRLDQRRLLMATQAAMGVFALILGALTIAGAVQLWHVYVLALVSGGAAAFDAPVRQTFVSELVGDEDLNNAVSLNSMSFNAANLIGPALSGLLIAAVGIGWAFLLNGISFLAVLASLTMMRRSELRAPERVADRRGAFVAGLRYVASRPDLLVILSMLSLVGTFCLNFPIFISVMAVRVFHADAARYGLLSSTVAVGTIIGAFLSARRERASLATLTWSAGLLGVGFVGASVAPAIAGFGASLVVVGVAYLTFITATNGLMQLTTEPAMRGRVMALRVAVALGGTPIGAPTVGWVADQLGPRAALLVGAVAALAAAGIAVFARRRLGEHLVS